MQLILKFAMRKRKTTEQFIKEAKEKHKNKYDYSLTKYEKSNIKVKIICKDHGIFEQTPAIHLFGHGCKQCGIIIRNNILRMSQDEFIKKAIDKYADKYDYSLVKYIGTEANIKIICNEHGEFEQTPHSFLRGSACKNCSLSIRVKKISLSKDEFISRSRKIH
jgi:hypothetical protein